MNVSFGLFPKLAGARVRNKHERHAQLVERARTALAPYVQATAALLA
jgi:folate-dependent tRNA-U54 methylase TrmFO/GidA